MTADDQVPTRRATWHWVLVSLSWITAAWIVALSVCYYTGRFGVRRHQLESASMLFVVALCAAIAAATAGRPNEAAPQADPSPTRRAICLILFVAAAFALYAKGLHLGLFGDDYVFLAASTEGRWDVWTNDANRFVRPSVLLAWSAIVQTVGIRPSALHGVNFFLHGLNAFLVSRLAARVGLSRAASLGAGALFLTFPALVEPVEWTCGIQDVLMTTGVLTFVVLATDERSDGARLLGAAFGFAVAIGAKETAIVAPLLAALFAFDAAVSRRQWALIVVAFVASLSYGFWRVAFAGVPHDYAVAPSRYFLKELMVRPVAPLVVPWRGIETHDVPVIGVAGVVLMIVLLMANAPYWSMAHRDFRRAARLLLWTYIAVAPVYSYLYIQEDLEGSRYLYLAACAWTILVAALIESATLAAQVEKLASPVIGLVAIAWASGVIVHLGAWQDSASMRDNIIRAGVVALEDTGCKTGSFGGLPHSTAGAVTFVNGFAEAMQFQVGAPVVVDVGSAPQDCAFTWTGGEFKRSP